MGLWGSKACRFGYSSTFLSWKGDHIINRIKSAPVQTNTEAIRRESNDSLHLDLLVLLHGPARMTHKADVGSPGSTLYCNVGNANRSSIPNQVGQDMDT